MTTGLLPCVSLKKTLKDPAWGLWGMNQVWVRGSALLLPPPEVCSGTLVVSQRAGSRQSCVCQGATPCASALSRLTGLISICVFWLLCQCGCAIQRYLRRHQVYLLHSSPVPLCPTPPVFPHAASDVLCSSTACTSSTHAWAQAHCM